MRKLVRRLMWTVTATVPVAVFVASATFAEATICQQCSSDRRLKKNIRPI